MKPIVTVHYNCGCGFKTTNPDEAASHVEYTGHTMEAAGKIKKGG